MNTNVALESAPEPVPVTVSAPVEDAVAPQDAPVSVTSELSPPVPLRESPPAAQACKLVLPLVVDVNFVRAQFPIFANRPDIVFFDNASTSQKPQAVVDCFTNFYARDCANAGRAAYQMSTELAAGIEEARKRTAMFIGAQPDSVAFTAGATESLNLIAQSWGLANLKSGDEVMLCLDDHKSAVLPWLNLARVLKSFGVEIKIVPIKLHPEGDYELKSIREGLSPRTRLIAVTHVHHVFGLDMEVSEVRKIVGSKVLISLDASQSVSHRPVNVDELDVDFLSFSGHKMFAGNGVGVLYVRPSLLPSLSPVTVGGGMTIADSATFSPVQATAAALFEAGTQNIPAIMSMVAAIDFIESIGIEAIDARVSGLTRKLYSGLKKLPEIEFSPGVDRCSCHQQFGIVSFRFAQAATSDLAFLLDSEGILVRAGDHCLSRRQDGDDYIRVSLHVYNTEADVDRLLEVLRANLQ